MINRQWLELPMSRTNLHGPKDVHVIEVRLCIAETVSRLVGYFITKTRLFKYIENFTTKNENFQIKIVIFFIFLLKT